MSGSLALGLAFGAISVIPLAIDLAKPSSEKATAVFITLGSTGKLGDDGNMGGSQPIISLYSEDTLHIGDNELERGGFLNLSKPKNWVPGSTNVLKINPNKKAEGKQATYINVGADQGDDAICIAAIAVAWPDGSNPKVWLGDIGFQCLEETGAFWANSKTVTGANKNDQSKCIWIDRNKSSGIPHRAVGLHISDFGGATGDRDKMSAVAAQWNKNKKLLCNAPGRMNFHFNALGIIWQFQPPLDYNDDTTDKDENAVLTGSCRAPFDGYPILPTFSTTCTKDPLPPGYQRRTARNRHVDKRSPQMINTLIHSKSPAHSAEDTCYLPGSHNSDLVSYAEGKFCDMKTRIVWPLCSEQISTGCFDAKQNRLILDQEKLSARDLERLAPRQDKEYEHVAYW